MSIIGMFKRLISGASAAPMVKVQTNTAPSKPKIFTTNEESQNNKIEYWKANQDVIEGLEFIATLQLRTPLRVLLRDGEIHRDKNTAPPKYAREMWEGIWTFKTRTFHEMGIDLPELPKSGESASDIGYVLRREYLPFLKAVREIVELDEPIEKRIEKLHDISKVDKWKSYIERHGGIEKIIRYFFPKFIDTIPSLNQSAEDELCKLGLNAPNRIAAAPDKTLLSIKGIGQAKLKAIRDYCAGITDNRDADRVENVIR
ncbi:MAG: hypothetical protein WAW22_09715 [Smithellaceae bacterium]